MRINPIRLISIWLMTILITIILTTMVVNAAVVDPEDVVYEVITHEEYFAQYGASESPTTIEMVEVEQQVEQGQRIARAGQDLPETYTITAYCSCEICCGEWATKRNGGPVVGAYGVELTPWYSVAAPLAYGTKLKIDGKTFEVQDTTASWIVDRYAGRIIDIYVGDNHKDAKAFGKHELEVEKLDGN